MFIKMRRLNLMPCERGEGSYARGQWCWWVRSRLKILKIITLVEWRIPHHVLNAKAHEREAEIAQAGRCCCDDFHQHGRSVPILSWYEMTAKVRTAMPSLCKILEECRVICQRTRIGLRGRHAYLGHRAPREPPHRQPVARSCGSPRRSGFVAILSLARR